MEKVASPPRCCAIDGPCLVQHLRGREGSGYVLIPRYEAAGSAKNKVVIATTKIPARKFELAFCLWFLGKRWQGSRIPLFTSLCSLDFDVCRPLGPRLDFSLF